MKLYFIKALLFIITCIFFTGGFFFLGFFFSDESSLLEEQYIEQSVYDSAQVQEDEKDTLTRAFEIIAEKSKGKDQVDVTPIKAPIIEKQIKEEKKHTEIDFSFIPSSFTQKWEEGDHRLSSILRSDIMIEFINSLTIALYEERHDVRGKMKNKTVKLYAPQKMDEDELVAVFIHEFAHYIDLYFYSRERGKKDISTHFYDLSWYSTIVIQGGQEQKDFVSGYAMTNKYEDFAESLTYYIFHNNDFRKKSENSRVLMKKYKFFETHLFSSGEFIGSDFSVGNSVKTYYRDITKIDFSKKKFLQYIKNSI